VTETGLRVLLTLPSLAREFGGPVDHARALRDSLRERGVAVRIVGAGVGDGEGLPVIGHVRGTPLPRSFSRLRRAVAGADLVHILGYRDPVGTVAASGAFKAGVPYVLEPCGMTRPRIRSVRAKRAFDATIGKPVLDRAAAVIATSELERRELVEDGIAFGRIRIRFNGIAHSFPNLGSQGRIRARFDVPSDAPLVLALGRITRKKGLLDLVDAVSRVPPTHLLIAGPDSSDGTLRTLRRRSPVLDGRLRIDSGGLWERDKMDAFADADCFALPSQTENFGNAAAEAATAGLPVVVSNACGVAEVLDPSAHRVIRVGDVDGLTAAIIDLTRGPGAKRSAASAAPHLRELLDWSTLAEVQLGIYQEVLSGTGIGTPTT
jgi:glycosyltransferase involved in cell wall biosynthesis